MSEAAKWYVVHTYSGYENKVATDITRYHQCGGKPQTPRSDLRRYGSNRDRC